MSLIVFHGNPVKPVRILQNLIGACLEREGQAFGPCQGCRAGHEGQDRDTEYESIFHRILTWVHPLSGFGLALARRKEEGPRNGGVSPVFVGAAVNPFAPGA